MIFALNRWRHEWQELRPHKGIAEDLVSEVARKLATATPDGDGRDRKC